MFESILYNSCDNGNIDLVQLSLTKGANPRYNDFKTAIDNGHVEIVRILRVSIEELYNSISGLPLTLTTLRIIGLYGNCSDSLINYAKKQGRLEIVHLLESASQ